MRRFRFRLAPLLKYREHLEKVAKQEVARAQLAVLQSKEKLFGLEDEYSKGIKALDEETAGGVEAGRYMRYKYYIAGKRALMESEKDSLKKFKAARVKKQADLSKKSRDRKLLEHLRDRKKQEYYEAVFKEIQKETDDMITVRKAREIVNNAKRDESDS